MPTKVGIHDLAAPKPANLTVSALGAAEHKTAPAVGVAWHTKRVERRPCFRTDNGADRAGCRPSRVAVSACRATQRCPTARRPFAAGRTICAQDEGGCSSSGWTRLHRRAALEPGYPLQSRTAGDRAGVETWRLAGRPTDSRRVQLADARRLALPTI